MKNKAFAQIVLTAFAMVLSFASAAFAAAPGPSKLHCRFLYDANALDPLPVGQDLLPPVEVPFWSPESDGRKAKIFRKAKVGYEKTIEFEAILEKSNHLMLMIREHEDLGHALIGHSSCDVNPLLEGQSASVSLSFENALKSASVILVCALK